MSVVLLSLLLVIELIQQGALAFASRALFTVWSFNNSTVQTAMITKTMIKFWSKFQSQILLQLY